MDEKYTYELKRIKMPVTISSISENNERNLQLINPDSLFLLTMQQGIDISSEIGEKLKKYNIFDLSCLHRDPDNTAFEQMIAFSLLYKSELGNPEEIEADNATASFVCGKGSEEFFKYLNGSGYSIIQCGNGIYRVNVLLINIFIILMSDLGKPESDWMEPLIRQAGGNCPEICINGLGCNFNIIEI